MLEFSVVAKDFRKSISLLLVNRAGHMQTDVAELRAVASSLELSCVGTEATLDAEVAQAGSVQVPLAVLKNIKRVAASYKLPRLHFRIEDGVFRIESYSLRDRAIELKRMGAKIADLPVNAGFLDTLAMVKLFSAEEIAECGLAARMFEAQQKATAAIELATSSLALFQVPREDIRKLLDAQVSRRASELKSNFRAFNAGAE